MSMDTNSYFANDVTQGSRVDTGSLGGLGAKGVHLSEHNVVHENLYSSRADKSATSVTRFPERDLMSPGPTVSGMDKQSDTCQVLASTTRIRSTLVANLPVGAHTQTLSPAPPACANICAVQTTDNPRVFVFRCTAPRCRRRVFGRWYDFNRHYNGTHAVEKTVFWCPVAGCIRGEDEGHRSFPRRDKMMDHALKIHGLDERNAIFQARDT
ncbi:hypothetical protein BKA63DRAFT_493581 [Paraphoma chrysanthemicola]|nr:hypothetical protein BKA63DRAFT_493581 [Paraphoma chrysanthemicola]